MKFANFKEFFDHLGTCPSGMSIDRINNNGHYEIGNVRWATKLTQMANRRVNRHIAFAGKTQTLAEWAREKRISTATLWARIEHYGWPLARALGTPLLSIHEVSKRGHAARWK